MANDYKYANIRSVRLQPKNYSSTCKAGANNSSTASQALGRLVTTISISELRDKSELGQKQLSKGTRIITVLVVVVIVVGYFIVRRELLIAQCPGYKNQTAAFGNTPEEYILKECYRSVAIEAVRDYIGRTSYRVWDFQHDTGDPSVPNTDSCGLLSALRVINGKIYGIDNGVAVGISVFEGNAVLIHSIWSTSTEFVYMSKNDVRVYRIVDAQSGEVSLISRWILCHHQIKKYLSAWSTNHQSNLLLALPNTTATVQ